MAYAIIRSGGKQYRVAEGDTVRVDLLTGAAGEKIKFDDVLLIGGDEPKIGKPLVSGASKLHLGEDHQGDGVTRHGS